MTASVPTLIYSLKKIISTLPIPVSNNAISFLICLFIFITNMKESPSSASSRFKVHHMKSTVYGAILFLNQPLVVSFFLHHLLCRMKQKPGTLLLLVSSVPTVIVSIAS
ncbi:UNVERIFIED_ORG: hypothetical protein ABRZ91_001909 [Heyndrickxia coagulans]